MKVEGLDDEFRTFETRLLFIQGIFLDKFKQTEIMTSGIQYKLKRSFENFEIDLRRSKLYLDGKDPLKVLKQENKRK